IDPAWAPGDGRRWIEDVDGVCWRGPKVFPLTRPGRIICPRMKQPGFELMADGIWICERKEIQPPRPPTCDDRLAYGLVARVPLANVSVVVLTSDPAPARPALVIRL